MTEINFAKRTFDKRCNCKLTILGGNIKHDKHIFTVESSIILCCYVVYILLKSYCFSSYQNTASLKISKIIQLLVHNK